MLDEQEKYPTLMKRFGSYLLDDLIVMFPLVYLETVTIESAFANQIKVFLLILLSFVKPFYRIILHTTFGQTLGKIAFKIQVVDLNENKIGLVESIKREAIFYPIIVFKIGLLIYFFQTMGLVEIPEDATIIQILFFTSLFTELANLFVLINSQDRRALHDLVAGTMVVHEQKNDVVEQE